MTALQEGRAEEMRVLCERILQLDPDHSAAHYYLGIALHRGGDNPHAVSHLERAVELMPNHPELRLNLGVAYHHQGDRDHAMEQYRRALALQPAFAEAWFNLGVAEQECGHYSDAIHSFDEVVQRDPQRVEAVRRRASCLARSNRADEAIEQLRNLLASTPADVDAALMLGNILSARKDWSGAIRVYETVLEVAPDDPSILNALAMAHVFKENFTRAEEILAAVLARQPDFTEALNNRGSVLALQGRYREALPFFERALASNTEHAATLDNYGTALTALNKFKRGFELHRQAIALDPDNPTFQYNLAINRLRAGDFAAGLEAHEWRLRKPGADKWGRPWRDMYPPWEGETLNSETLLVYREQGIGDEIYFLGFLDRVTDRCRDVAVICDARLVPLMSRSCPRVRFFSEPGSFASGPTTRLRHCAMGSLARYTGADLARERPSPYLSAVLDQVAAWREHLALLGPGRKVGISWRGGAVSLERARRSIALKDWAMILETPGCCFIDMQYDDRKEERTQVENALGVDIRRSTEIDAMKDLDSFAALLGALDLLITVDNSTAHLGGALGKECWVLLPSAGDWRWGVNANNCPAYPSVRLFRQPNAGNWRQPIERIAGQLAQHP